MDKESFGDIDIDKIIEQLLEGIKLYKDTLFHIENNQERLV